MVPDAVTICPRAISLCILTIFAQSSLKFTQELPIQNIGGKMETQPLMAL